MIICCLLSFSMFTGIMLRVLGSLNWLLRYAIANLQYSHLVSNVFVIFKHLLNIVSFNAYTKIYAMITMFAVQASCTEWSGDTYSLTLFFMNTFAYIMTH